MKMKTVLKGRAQPKWKEEVKMKNVFYLLLFYVVSCHVMFRHVSVNCP